jgi:RNA polymerase sigma-70 factor (ECF subfamily)
MSEIYDYNQLVGQAQLGDKESLELLARKARGELSAYIYRITLDFDLTEDILQETLMEMVRSVKSLRDRERFRSWLYRIASNKIKKHYRITGNKRIMNKTVFDADKLSQQTAQSPDGLSQMLKKELAQAITRAMTKLKYNYRNVLILRCFEQMSYPDIAYSMGCSSIEAQLLFFRAKQSLKKQLQNEGYKKEHLLASLGIFAAKTEMPFKGTAASAAAVAPSTMEVGTLATLLGAMTTKLGILGTVLTAVTLLTVSAAVADRKPASIFHIIAEQEFSEARYKYPTQIAGDYNPQGIQWKGIPGSNHLPEPISVEKQLLKPHADYSAILIPKDGWLLLMYPSVIVDGPGDDIIIVEKCKCGEKADIFLADNQGNEMFIGSVIVPDIQEHSLTYFGCDISEFDLPFAPTTIKILATDGGSIEHGGAEPGFDLISVRASITN